MYTFNVCSQVYMNTLYTCSLAALYRVASVQETLRFLAFT